MKKVTMIAAVFALMALPASASAETSAAEKKEATEDCRAERNAAGAENFGTLYRSFGQCVTQTVRENRAEQTQARREAAADCDAQDLEDSELKQCVRSERTQNLAEAEAEDQAELNAARDCRAERNEAGAEAFAEQYETNHNQRNAFGKCVSSRAQQEESEETETQTTPEDGEETTEPEETEQKETEPEKGTKPESDDGDEETQPEDDGEETTESEETEPEDDGEETTDDDTEEDDG